MPEEPTEAEVKTYALARRTPVMFASGRLVEKGGAMQAADLQLVMISVGGIPRVILEDEPAHPIVEMTAARVVSARMESRFLDASAIVEVRVQGDDSQTGGEGEYFVLVGPKQMLKRAFASIGVGL